jgi:raffinose/stachyose/melibiose transport system substrate-binding protein
MVAKFGAGTGVFLMAGSWSTATLDPLMPGNLGFFAPPPVTGDPASTTCGTSLPFTITSASKHADAAAAYINFITSDDAMKVIAKAGHLSVLHSAELAPAAGGGKDVYAPYEAVTSKGNLLPYLDYATPTFRDTLGAALQDLIAGKQTPQQFTTTLQADYGKYVSK